MCLQDLLPCQGFYKLYPPSHLSDLKVGATAAQKIIFEFVATSNNILIDEFSYLIAFPNKDTL